MTRSLVIAGLVATSIVGAVATADADVPPPRTSSLAWVRLPGAEACIDMRSLAEAVELRLGRPAFGRPDRGPWPAPELHRRGPPAPRLPPSAVPSALPGALVGGVLALGVVVGMAWRDAASSPPAALTPASRVTTPVAPIAAPRLVDPQTPAPSADPRDTVRVSASTSSSMPRGDASADRPQGEPPSVAEASGASPSGASVVIDEETEAHLLQRAQSALGADPGGALSLAGEHARRFPGGALGQERELIAVTALVALGRTPEAQARATRLLERFPGSAYRGRLESLGLGR